MKGESWYYKRIPPIFFSPCQPLYEAVHPAKLIILVVAFVLWVAGVLILLGTCIACVAAYCTPGVYGSLIPLAVLLMVLGYCLFHCAWAAYLLDEPDKNTYFGREVEEVIIHEPEASEPLVSSAAAAPMNEQGGPPPPDVPLDPMKYGHWKFVPDSPWQNKCSRDNLQ